MKLIEFLETDDNLKEIISLEGLVLSGNIVLGKEDSLTEDGGGSCIINDEDAVTHSVYFGENIKRVIAGLSHSARK